MTFHIDQVSRRNCMNFPLRSVRFEDASSTNSNSNYFSFADSGMDLRNLSLSPSGVFEFKAPVLSNIFNDRIPGIAPRGTPFPLKLYFVACSDDDMILWTGDGAGIFIPDINKFESEVLDRFRGFVQIPTFLNIRRQLRQYGFDWIVNKRQKNIIFSHACFLRGHPELLQHVVTRRKQGRRRSGSRSDEDFQRQRTPNCLRDSFMFRPLDSSPTSTVNIKNWERKQPSSKIATSSQKDDDEVSPACHGHGILANDTEWVPCCIKYLGHLYYFDDCQLGCQCGDFPSTPTSSQMEVKFWRDDSSQSNSNENVIIRDAAETELSQTGEQLSREEFDLIPSYHNDYEMQRAAFLEKNCAIPRISCLLSPLPSNASSTNSSTSSLNESTSDTTQLSAVKAEENSTEEEYIVVLDTTSPSQHQIVMTIPTSTMNNSTISLDEINRAV